MRGRVLVVDDDADVRSLVCEVLEAEGFEALPARDGEEGVELVRSQSVDAVILDVAMPRVDGWAVLEEIRSLNDVPVLMLSARQREADKVRGLRAGADDYVTKPFGREELLARLEAVMRRRAGRDGSTAGRSVTDEQLYIDFPARRVRVEGLEVALTPLEFRLLEVLVRHPGQVLSHDQLIELVWGAAQSVGRQQVAIYVGYLRRKLGKACEEELIETVRGFGYRYRPPKGSDRSSPPPA